MKHLNTSLCLALVAIIAANIFGTRESSAMIGIIAAALCIVALVLTFKGETTKELIARPASTLSTLVLGRNYKRPGFLVFAARLTIYTVATLSVTEYYHAAFGVAIAGIHRLHTKYEVARDAVLEPQPLPIADTEPAPEQPTQTPIARTYDIDELRKMVTDEATAQGVSSILALAVAQHESGWQVDATKYEPAYLNHQTCRGIGHPDRRRLCASSHGIFQVMFSIHKNACGLDTFSQLYDPQIGIRCGVKVLSDCVHRWENAPKWQRINKALVCFNGSEDYPPKVLVELGSLVAEGLA